jgi:hypothetical protein
MDTPTLTFTKVTATGAGSQGPASLATADGTQVRADPCVRITSGGTTNTMVFPDVSLRYNIYSLERTAKVDKLLCVPLPTAPRRSNLALETVEYPSDTVYDNSKRGDYSLDGSLVTCTHRYKIPAQPVGAYQAGRGVSVDPRGTELFTACFGQHDTRWDDLEDISIQGGQAPPSEPSDAADN